ncbi:MAG: tRNA guanosine(34) transglycosylase Tgt [Candidatus Zambryskibacteria bacterium RIFCSPLOWO2_02_FULL_51_21]|uniref:Queuine tRNA-ribosyltransferase n=1 Tax=Candidatus Zambryskibacteria bacterium RIFCSPHIGHO2_02_FULL_43_37 TaxID=1802749 RepID=A0A1G2THS0_9BACT|nr:MAG: tRNA guanosine(34) transglycosylase Tgt [Candidatus Zambryskibacteria bacterium RIFCSPHIGHO2_01_FULL_52_18]OHA96608.1 MAG: tRNA guanosine(34) transglycosylase Tgt [Candidatus Zambryskibacteria bacterium RIFCSPHIGHO2_02_FULL_43_37]OHB07215.1 MAG: tRNA guanosine(34) transglycosylase Tgt [Candidatus Zambryskibacteria bacterium RIFCSPLOWO2_01_FULL_52_12]OHB11466.1 MAG: tRNA guanosine(34) transglycosylase Tgt [Candidatus Zambryskibacteria bacterium RIFCSPLOWO2_02_FULL_51_21]
MGRAGKIETPHGVIETPTFVAVGTKASVKALTPEQILETGAQVVLANTYHLYLEPGDERVKNFGGLHKFMNWQGPMMTDSGGFQVFSLGAAYGKELSKITKITDPSQLLVERSLDGEAPRLARVGQDGVSFRSHHDGSLHYITPEKSIEIQHNLGADIIFAFDECTSPSEGYRYQEEALERTHRWAQRSLDYHKSKPNAEFQALFGIVQGGREESLRRRSAEFIGSLDFDGFGIGGSFAKEDMETAVKWVNEILPKDKPRHLLGIGEPEDLFMGVENGVDLFDCVAPTRNGRGGTLYTSRGKINIKNAEYREDQGPVDEECECSVCKNYSRAYLCHLYRAHEMLGGTLGSIHNLYFIINLVKNMRRAILENRFPQFKNEFLAKYRKE